MSRCIASGISSYVPLFPPGVPVTVVVDGRFLGAYATAYVAGGRVFAPADPLLVRLADRVYYEGRTLVVERGARRIAVALVPPPSGLHGVYVMAAPLLRALGAAARFDARERILYIRTAHERIVASPTPFNAAMPSAPPATVFTPEPAATPRPIWTGSPLPRRTPLPFFTPPVEATQLFR